MFSHVAQAKLVAVVREHGLEVAADESQTLVLARRACVAATGEIARGPARQPRLAVGAASDHHAIGARGGQTGAHIGEALDVAVDDHRYFHRVLDLAHERPVGLVLEELAAGAAMHGDHADAGGFRAHRQLRRVERAVIPAHPHFQRHRHVDGVDRGFDEPEREARFAHQRRAGHAARHQPGRTAHVDVDDVGAEPHRHLGALGHPARLAASKLDDEGRMRRLHRFAQHVTTLAHQRLAGDHLGDDERSTGRVRDVAERQIGDAGHWSEYDRIGEGETADLEGRGQSVENPFAAQFLGNATVCPRNMQQAN